MLSYRNYMNFKRCPKCNSYHLEVGIVMQRFIELNKKEKLHDYTRDTDAGFTKCLNCGYTENVGTPNGKGEILMLKKTKGDEGK